MQKGWVRNLLSI